MNCTCPHHYTATGLQRYGTDACCPAHGAPKAPVASPPSPLALAGVPDGPGEAFRALFPECDEM